MSRVGLFLLVAFAALVAFATASTFHPVSHLSSADYAEYCRLVFDQKHGPLRRDAKAAPNGGHGVDISALHSEEVQRCMVQDGMLFNIPRGYRSNGNPDQNVAANVKNAYAAGFEQVDLYFFPCPTCMKTPQRQVAEFVNATMGVNYGLVWFDIEAKEYWFPDHAKNQQFAEEMVAAFQEQGLAIGLYANGVQWNDIFGAAYMGLPGFPTWVPRYRRVPNPICDDLPPFGTYTRFDIKQFTATTEYCGGSVDLNSYCYY